MIRLLAQMRLLGQVRYGFYGIHGFFGVLLGVCVMLVFVWGIFTVFEILKKKFGNENTGWMFEIIRVVLIVFTVVYFFNVMFSLFPM